MSKKMKHKDVIKLVKRNEAQVFVEAGAGYLKKHTENIIIWAVACIIVVVGGTVFINSRAANALKAEEGVAEASYYMTRPVVNDERAAMYGMFRTKKEKYEKAQETFMSVIKNYKNAPSAAAAYLGLADAYFCNAEYKEAAEYYDDFMKKFPGSQLVSEALNGKAYSLFQQGQYADAQKIWEQVNEKYKGGLNPGDVKLNLAYCCLKLGNKQAAKQEYDDILKDKTENYWTSVAKDMISKTN